MKFRDLLPFNWKKNEPEKPSRSLQRRNVFDGPFDDIFSDFDRFFERPFGDFGLMKSDFNNLLNPNVNISETKKEIKVEAELPGMDEKDIDVTIDDGYLTIRGEKKREFEDEKSYRTECSYGLFERRFPLPSYAKAEKAKASYNRGVLRLTIPKDEQKEKGKQIPISIN